MTSPVWGCPWHGPVRNGLVELPNDTTRSYPQPASIFTTVGGVTTRVSDTTGAAHRLFVPGTPPVVRSTEELAADEEAGREWRNEAVLAGARLALHGKNLDGWIYIDPDGVRWRVTCAQLDENTLRSLSGSYSGTLVLSRFGELGRPAESHSYPFSCAWGIDGADAPTTARVRLDALRSDGSAAIVMVHERRVTSVETQIRWPHSFLELNISGAGAEAVVSCSVAKLRSQVSQATRSYDPGENWLAGYYTGPPGFTPTWRVQLASTPPGPGEGNFNEWGGRVCQIFSAPASLNMRRTLAIWYDAAGDKQDVDFVLAWSGDLDYPEPTTTGVTITGTATWTAHLEVGGVPSSPVAGSWSATSTETLVPPAASGTRLQERTVVVDGISYPESFPGTSDPTIWVKLAFDASFLYLDGPEFLLTSRVESGATTFSGHLAVARYSPQVIGLATQRSSNYAFYPPLTPSGGAIGTVQIVTKRPYYGAWDPFSGDSAWLELSPVCWV